MTGGVPKYIELFQGDGDVYAMIAKNMMNPNSYLYAELEFLLEKEVSEIGSYFSLLRIIALGSHNLSEIAARMELPQSGISRYLKTLEELDILERETPITEEQPEKSKMGQYLIQDHFMRFWFQFIYPYCGRIESGNTAFVEERIRKHFLENHVSYVYESLCRKRIWSMGDRLPEVTRVGRRWNNRDAEIDLVAYRPGGNEMVFGECKYSSVPKDVDALWSLREKALKVDWKRTHRKEYYVLFSKSGFTERLRQAADEDGVLLVEG